MKVNSLAVYFFRELFSRPFWQHLKLLYTCAFLKREKGEMDTLTPEYCNLMVVGGCYLQVCRLECKNASYKGIGHIITKPERIT